MAEDAPTVNPFHSWRRGGLPGRFHNPPYTSGGRIVYGPEGEGGTPFLTPEMVSKLMSRVAKGGGRLLSEHAPSLSDLLGLGGEAQEEFVPPPFPSGLNPESRRAPESRRPAASEMTFGPSSEGFPQAGPGTTFPREGFSSLPLDLDLRQEYEAGDPGLGGYGRPAPLPSGASPGSSQEALDRAARVDALVRNLEEQRALDARLQDLGR